MQIRDSGVPMSLLLGRTHVILVKLWRRIVA